MLKWLRHGGVRCSELVKCHHGRFAEIEQMCEISACVKRNKHQTADKKAQRIAMAPNGTMTKTMTPSNKPARKLSGPRGK
jgi:hypothetical protein